MKQFLVLVRTHDSNEVAERAEFDTPADAQGFVNKKEAEGLRADILADFSKAVAKE